MRYEFLCSKCNKAIEIIRPMAEAHLPASCPQCANELSRIYSSQTQDEFKEYYSGDCGQLISSREGEKRALKAKGLMLYADTPGYDKWRGKIKEKRREGKVKHFMMGV